MASWPQWDDDFFEDEEERAAEARCDMFCEHLHPLNADSLPTPIASLDLS